MANFWDAAPVVQETPKGNFWDAAPIVGSPEVKQDPSEPGFIPALKRGAAGAVIGTAQLLKDAGADNLLSVVGRQLPDREVLNAAAQSLEEQGRGTGFTGLAGEILGNPLTPIGVSSLPMLAAAGGVAGATAPVTNDQGMGTRATNAAIGAVSAPVLGVAAQKVVAPVANRAVNATRATLSGVKNLVLNGSLQNVDSAATQKVAQALARDGIPVNDVLTELAKYPQKPTALMDTGGENVKGLVRAVTRTPGEAKTTLRNFAQERVAGQEERVLQDTKRLLGGKDYADTVDDLMFARQKAAEPAYAKAYAYSEDLMQQPGVRDIVSRPFFRDALKKAVDESRITGQPLPQNVVAHLADDGSLEKITTEFALDTRTADLAKRGMDSLIQAAKSDPEKRYLLGPLQQARNQFVNAIDEVNPAYKAAREQFSGSIRSQQAMEAGRDAVKMDPDEIARTIGKLEGKEADFFKQGFQKGLQDIVENTANGADAVKRIFNNTMKQKRLKAVLGSNYDDFAASMQHELKLYENSANAIGRNNSITAEATQDANDLGINLIQAAAKGKSGLLGLLEQYGMGAIDRARGLRNDQINARIAELLASRNVLPEVRMAVRKATKAGKLIDGKTISGLLPASVAGASARLTAPSSKQEIPSVRATYQPMTAEIMTQDTPNSAGVENSFAAKLGRVESSNNPNAKAKTSSALGKHQIIDSTWNHLYRKRGRELGLTPNGRTDTRKDANGLTQSDRATNAYAEENAKALAQKGIEPTETALHLAHFLGAGGAVKLLKASDKVSAAQILPTAASKNQPIFYKNGRPRTVQEVRELMQKKWEMA